jgi:hypothetical protein
LRCHLPSSVAGGDWLSTRILRPRTDGGLVPVRALAERLALEIRHLGVRGRVSHRDESERPLMWRPSRIFAGKPIGDGVCVSAARPDCWSAARSKLGLGALAEAPVHLRIRDDDETHGCWLRPRRRRPGDRDRVLDQLP